ncbi:RIP metalloprotease RseP [Erythrobacter sp. F6033]|uniref:RIP metalloprotease RseP n=1 Tax=Erythrobacter sp. F6033 TaxID=2926401 RepID=UPI001FF69CBD|nr:RIP metalloprotease RseP [Erythrobacter sp. F6033]MCK0128701.1 RIP metalloprotease RseP [Erythrobacter sp. F6033]
MPLFESPPFWMYIVGFLFVLGPLITLHELGHYLVGRWFGVKAEAFSVGFGKEIWGRTDKHGTRWKLSALPLGGYVQFKGDMNPASAPDTQGNANATPEQSEGNFHHAALWKRALIVAAGPVTNLLITFALFATLFAVYGKVTIVGAEDSRIVGEFSETSVAKAAGIELGDKIVAIDKEPVEDFESIRREVALYPERAMVVTVERDGATMDFPLTTARVTQTDTFGNTSDIGLLGVGPYGGEYVLEEVGVLESVPVAVAHTGDVFSMMLTGIKQILTGERSIKELGGPIKIAKYSGEQMSLGLTTFVNFVALISLNLAFINILPIPALDGGHLAFYAAEAVRKKPVGPQATEWAYRTGIALVLVFMVVVTFNDVTSLSIFGAIFG